MPSKFAAIWIVAFAFLSNSLVFADKPRVAVIGGGGAGLTATWLLEEEYDVTLYEIQQRLGGHANTVIIDDVPIEAGFEFIQKNQFPHFYHLLKNLIKVPLHKYTLTTTFYHVDKDDVLTMPPLHDGVVEWNSFEPHDIVTLFELNLVIEQSKSLIKNKNLMITLEEFIDDLILTSCFKNDFLYPFLAAGWGVKPEDIKKFSAYNALKYLVKGSENYQWLEIVGGTQTYINALAAELRNAIIKLNSKISNITYENGIYTITEINGASSQFDHLVIGTNSMQGRDLLKNVFEAQTVINILSQISYFKTTIAVHGDKRFMPIDEDDWRIVNVRYNGQHSAMTVHKKWLSPDKPIFRSWITHDVRATDDQGSELPNPLYALVHYNHPITDLNYYKAQKELAEQQGIHNLWFVGYYTHDNDSHESAIVSAMKVAQRLSPESERLQQLTITK